MLDTGGCAIFGSPRLWGKIIIEFMNNLKDKQEAGVWGSAIKVMDSKTIQEIEETILNFEKEDHLRGLGNKLQKTASIY